MAPRVEYELHRSLKGLPYTEAMHNYLRDNQYRDPRSERCGATNIVGSAPREVERGQPVRLASDSRSNESSITCLPLTLQRKRALQPSWGVCGQEPHAARPQALIHGAVRYLEEPHRPDPRKWGHNEDTRENWIESPEVKEEWQV